MLKVLISLAPYGEAIAGVLAKVPPRAYLIGTELAIVAAALILAGTDFDRYLIAAALIATNATAFARGRLGRTT